MSEFYVCKLLCNHIWNYFKYVIACCWQLTQRVASSQSFVLLPFIVCSSSRQNEFCHKTKALCGKSAYAAENITITIADVQALRLCMSLLTLPLQCSVLCIFLSYGQHTHSDTAHTYLPNFIFSVTPKHFKHLQLSTAHRNTIVRTDTDTYLCIERQTHTF